jgi:SHS2 domain-containing protein
MSAASHEFLEHVGELELRVRAPTAEELFVEAGRALGLELLRGMAGDPDDQVVELDLEAADQAALLVDFLNEIIYQADSQGRALVRYDLLRVGDTELRGRAWGVRLTAAAPVKAATYHGIQVERDADGLLTARVILDV